MKLPTVSICVPAFELGGRGVSMLTKLFKSVEMQTYKDYEVMVSDHSLSDEILDLCKAWHSKLPKLAYIKNERNRGSCEANLNNAIEHADGKFIKPMLQDDFFLLPDTLETMMQRVKNDKTWVAVGCLHCREDEVDKLFHPHSPTWIPDRSMALGQNRVGSPSVVLYPNASENRLFDHNLLWLMDCEFYYRLGLEIGAPTCVPNHMVCIRFRHDSISDSQVTDDLRGEEFRYIQAKIDKTGEQLNGFPLMYERLQRCDLI